MPIGDGDSRPYEEIPTCMLLFNKVSLTGPMSEPADQNRVSLKNVLQFPSCRHLNNSLTTQPTSQRYQSMTVCLACKVPDESQDTGASNKPHPQTDEIHKQPIIDLRARSSDNSFRDDSIVCFGEE